MTRVRSHPVPAVGDKVVLNDDGLRTIYGTTVGLAHMKTKVMRITEVGDESMTEPEETFIVQVDDPEINQFMLTNWCVNILREEA